MEGATILNPPLIWVPVYVDDGTGASQQVTDYPDQFCRNVPRAAGNAVTASSNANGYLLGPTGAPARKYGLARLWVELYADDPPTVLLDLFGYVEAMPRGTALTAAANTRRWAWLGALDASVNGGGVGSAIVVDTARWSPTANSIIVIDNGFDVGCDYERLKVRPTVLTGTNAILNVWAGMQEVIS